MNCSFCSKGQSDVKKLVAGPGVYICDECVTLCNEIIDEEAEAAASETDSPADLPKTRPADDILPPALEAALAEIGLR